MSARRQPSTTSLSQYARAHQADEQAQQNRSLDFCNAFWGVADEGVDVLFARMRGATRTVDELRNFWKERWAIEEEYAKKMAKLAKVTLGRDEIGDLRAALDIIKAETDQQASFHLRLAQTIRNDLETQSANFHNKQTHHKRTYQTGIERQFKAKQTQESYVTKAREKYESDCMRINSYTAQATLVQGRELEKLQLRLQRTEQTVQANERDFANFARALADTTAKWELDWKAFCDSCQDLEEERMDFMKDIMWAYANAVSTVCVSDDESCEKIRLSLETIETDKDMENFVRDYGTGPLIPDPPGFVNYQNPDAIPSASSRPTSRTAQFPRSTQRARPPPPPPPQDEEPTHNIAGVGAGGGQPLEPEPSNLTRTNTRRSLGAASTLTNGAMNGGPASSSSLARRPTNASYRTPVPEPQASPSREHQRQGSISAAGSSAPTPAAGSSSAGELDPLAKQMEELRTAVSSGSVRRGTTTSRHTTNDSTSLSIGPSSPQRGASPDYRNSAEMVVGGHPPTSRPVSPNPPAPVMMKPATSPVGSDVVANYEQSFPGERRAGSRRNSYIAPPAASPGNAAQPNLGRPTSQIGHPGIGAHGGGSRSASPQPASRSTSPMPTTHRNSYIAPPQNAVPSRNGSINRAPSPNSVGIAIDASGRVAMDDMADRYAQRPSQQSPQNALVQQHHSRPSQQQIAQQPPPAQNPQSIVPYNAQPGRAPVYTSGPAAGSGAMIPAPAQPPYNAPSVSPQYQPQQQAVQPVNTGYGHVQHPSWQGPPPPATGHMVPYNNNPPAAPAPTYTQPPQNQLTYPGGPQNNGYANVNGVNRGPSIGGGGYNQRGQQQQYPQQAIQQGYNQQQIGYRRSPSPQPPQQQPPQQGMAPTGQTTEEGAPILFYVQALYDYQATIDEEFDFQAGDIIAVTATPEDGWWSGELLDEARRQRGRHVFPSNFVCLLE